jgi:hypothetical protein
LRLTLPWSCFAARTRIICLPSSLFSSSSRYSSNKSKVKMNSYINDKDIYNKSKVKIGPCDMNGAHKTISKVKSMSYRGGLDAVDSGGERAPGDRRSSFGVGSGGLGRRCHRSGPPQCIHGSRHRIPPPCCDEARKLLGSDRMGDAAEIDGDRR